MVRRPQRYRERITYVPGEIEVVLVPLLYANGPPGAGAAGRGSYIAPSRMRRFHIALGLEVTKEVKEEMNLKGYLTVAVIGGGETYMIGPLGRSQRDPPCKCRLKLTRLPF